MEEKRTETAGKKTNGPEEKPSDPKEILQDEIGLLKREFRIAEEKLKVASDEEVVNCIRDRWKKLGTDKLYTYLAGPIETFGDFGATWREWLTPELLQREIIPLDPVKFESYKTGLPPGETLKKMDELRKRRNWAEFRSLAGRVRYIDTNLIRHKTSFIIMHVPSRVPHIDREALTTILSRRLPEILTDLDKEEQELAVRLISTVFPDKVLPEIFKAMARGEATGGTSSENQVATIEKIPVLLVCFKDALDTFSSSWVLDAVLERGKIFLRFNSLLKFLDQNLAKIRGE